MECRSTRLQWLYEFAGYRQELGHVVLCNNPGHPKHAAQVTVIMATMQELGPFQLPGITYRSLQQGLCIIMLQHEVMVGNKWNSGPQDLISLCLCIQNAINKLYLYVLSKTYSLTIL